MKRNIFTRIIAIALVAMSIMAIAIPAFAVSWSTHYGPGILYSNTTGSNTHTYVTNLQYDIRKLTGYNITVDGYYGNQTKLAVKYLQRYLNNNYGYSLDDDGVAGPLTKEALFNLVSCAGNHPVD